MKNLLITLSFIFPTIFFSQEPGYQVSSYLDEGTKAPNTHYIGEAWLNPLLQADENLDYNITKATFRANSTLDWHKHATPQVLIIVEGEAYYQEKGKNPVILNLGMS